MDKTFRSGFVALVGRPNCGKSTLMNTVLGEELAIVTSLPQTTRQNLKGIYTSETMQIIFVDTPGIHRGSHSFNKSMVSESAQLLKRREVDVVCYLIDLSRPYGPEEDLVARSVTDSGGRACLVFNKKDLCRDSAYAKDEFFLRYPQFKSTVALTITATSPEAKNEFLQAITPMLSEGRNFFPKTTLPMRTYGFLRRSISENK